MNTIQMVSIASTTRYTVIEGEYPRFTNVRTSFNQKIRDDINRGIQEHMKISAENWNARYETAPQDQKISQFPSQDEKFMFVASTTIIRNDTKVISFVIYSYEYTGGAHGMESIMTYNYDVPRGKEITLADIIASDTAFLQKLSKVSREMLRNDLAARAEVKPESIDESMLHEGTTAIPSNFSLFTLPKNEEITFYFTQYQVAAYVFGSSEIRLRLPLK